jgi:phospho-N-acetylmuramoyl-pentapeptide-transferase
MLYHLFTYLKQHFDIPGAGVFYFISFRAALAIILSLIISLVYGKRLIKYLHRKQIGETVRDLGLAGEKQNSGTDDGWYHYHSSYIDSDIIICSN